MKPVLLIEDDPLNRKLLRDILEIRFHVVDAPTAARATEILQQYEPCLIFLDLQLPDADGLAYLQTLKSETRTSHIPVVAITARAFPHEKEKGLAYGCAEYITKPIAEDPYKFVKRMEVLVGGTMEADFSDLLNASEAEK